MYIFESLENLNVLEECFDNIMEKLTDVINRAITKGKLAPFKKGTKLGSYWYKKDRTDKIVPGDTTAELYVKAEKVTPSDSKTSDKQTNRILNNTPWGASDELASKLHGIKLHGKEEKDLINDDRLMKIAKEKSQERNKKKSDEVTEDYDSYKEQKEEENTSQSYKDLANVNNSIRRNKTKNLKAAAKEYKRARKEELQGRNQPYTYAHLKQQDAVLSASDKWNKAREEEKDAQEEVDKVRTRAKRAEDWEEK